MATVNQSEIRKAYLVSVQKKQRMLNLVRIRKYVIQKEKRHGINTSSIIDDRSTYDCSSGSTYKKIRSK